MAAFRTSWAGGGTSGTTDRTASVTAPTVGDILVVVCGASGNTNATPTCSDDQGGSYQLIGTALSNTSADILSVFVRKQAVGTTSTHVVTVATGSNTAAEIVVVAYSGVTRLGIEAVRSSGFQANQAAAGTPAPALNQSALTGNPTITGCFNSTAGGSVLVPNASWTERQDVSQSTPTAGVEVATRDSGFTSTTITAGGTSATAFASFAIELDTSAATPRANAPMSSVAALAMVPLLALGAALAPSNFAQKADARPFINAPITAADSSRIRQALADGSRSSRAIYDTAPATVLKTPLFINRRELPPVLYLPADSTRGQPATLQVVAQPPPVVNAPVFAPVRALWQPADSTSDTPKTLTADAQVPVFVQSSAPPRPLWQTADTSRGIALAAQVIALPPGQSANVYLAQFSWPLFDSSRGSAKTLVADAQAPVGNQQTHTAPDRVRPISDTTADTPKTLTADAQLPIGNAQTYTAPDRVRPVTDTTLGTSLAARAVVVVALPPGQATNAYFLRVPWAVVDSSRSSAKPLIADSQQPVGADQTFTAPDRIRPVTDTTAQWLKTVYGDAQQPVGEAQVHTAPDRVRPITDTSVGTPKALFADAQLPIGAAAFISTAERSRYLSNTSASTPYSLLAVVVAALPPGQQNVSLAPPRPWQPLDTTQRSYLATYQIVAPFIPAQHLAPQRSKWQPADTSSGTPKAAYVDATVPFRNPPQWVQDRSRVLPASTAQGTSRILIEALTPPPGAASPHFTPSRWPLLSETSKGSALAIVVPQQLLPKDALVCLSDFEATVTLTDGEATVTLTDAAGTVVVANAYGTVTLSHSFATVILDETELICDD